MTSSIARMNCFLHGIEDFRIERGDTLSEPKLVEGDRLMRFDLVLANPPYSIKQWNREAFSSDPLGAKSLRYPAAGPGGLRFLAAHPAEPDTQGRALRDPVSARRAVPAGRGRDTKEASRGRCHRMRARAGSESVLQLADGSLRCHLPRFQT